MAETNKRKIYNVLDPIDAPGIPEELADKLCRANTNDRDMIGKKIYDAKVIGFSGLRNSQHYWVLKCTCGEYFETTKQVLARAQNVSCGCKAKSPEPHADMWARIGRLSERVEECLKLREDVERMRRRYESTEHMPLSLAHNLRRTLGDEEDLRWAIENQHAPPEILNPPSKSAYALLQMGRTSPVRFAEIAFRLISQSIITSNTKKESSSEVEEPVPVEDGPSRTTKKSKKAILGMIG